MSFSPIFSLIFPSFFAYNVHIFVDLPYFNEPGYETQMNTPQGTKASNEYNEVIRQGTLRWAILEQLKYPSPGFEEVIRTHFKIKKEYVLKVANDWLKDAQSSKTSGYEMGRVNTL